MKKQLLLLVMILLPIWASAYDIAVQNADGLTIYYNYINNGTELEVTSGDPRYSGSVVIPEEATYMNRTRKVTSIGERAFAGCNITSIIIPNSVTIIENNAFRYCQELTSVKIPNSVTIIGDKAFLTCHSLTTVTIGNSVTKIGNFAFDGCSRMTSVTIGNSVTTIGAYAFEDCRGLTSIIIPNSVTTIGEEAFQECSGLTSVTISNSLTTIEDGVFWGCSGLTSVTIPNSVTSIGNGAFERCSGLTSVTIGNSVTTIGEEAFQGCSGLTSITIPNSVKGIRKDAFSGWDLPEVISKNENPVDISTVAFSKNTFLNATLYVPKGTVDKYKSQIGWKNFAFIEEGDPTGINTIELTDKDNGIIYDLNGRRVEHPTKGLYIKNGKKYVVK